MRRRRFFQYAGLGSLSLLLTTRERAVASGLRSAGSQQLVAANVPLKTPLAPLETFEFSVATVNQAGRVKQRQKLTAQFFAEALPKSLSTTRATMLPSSPAENRSVTERLAAEKLASERLAAERLISERLEMVAIAPGQFWMGSSHSESQSKSQSKYPSTSQSKSAESKSAELPRHQVNLSSFFISKYPITQSQWAAIAALPKIHRDLNPAPAHFRGSNLPVESIAWVDAVEFCDRLSQYTGRQYQLPTEAQWEYACRAGTETPFHTGETITSDLADYVGTYTYKAERAGSYRQSTLPVGQFSPNAFGLNDMHGNVWEWCADSWQSGYHSAQRNGHRAIAAQPSQLRAIRGGSWLDAPNKLRSASRSGYLETALNRTIGFRVVAA